jgi:Tfp pilus assembly protein PilO
MLKKRCSQPIRLERALPNSVKELEADKDLLRADFAMSTRRLELSNEQLRNKTANQLAELGRKSDILNRLKAQRDVLKVEMLGLKVQIAALKKRLDRDHEDSRPKFHHVGAMLRQLPSDTEVPGLIEDITLAALDNGLTIESIDLQQERKAEFYVELPITIVVSGEYHDIGAFVSAVANLSRIVTLHDFEIKPSPSPANLKMSIVAKTYRYSARRRVMRAFIRASLTSALLSSSPGVRRATGSRI